VPKAGLRVGRLVTTAEVGLAQTTSSGDVASRGGVEPGSTAAPSGRVGRWFSRHTSEWVEYAQDVVSGAVAVALVVLAAGLLVASVVDFATSAHKLGLTEAATDFVDRVLLILILVEIVHTVVLSLKAHALVAQPFIVVGLIAVIRKILFVLAGQQKPSVTTLGLYIGMVGIFVAALVAIELLPHHRKLRETGTVTELP
jgi:uncharacterized membrane protein (DUF373 family)